MRNESTMYFGSEAIVYFCTSSLYGCLGVFALIQLVRIIHHNYKYRREISALLSWRRQVLCGLAVSGAFIRMSWFLLQPLIYSGEVVITHATDILLNLFPTFLFLATFSIVLALLVELYHRLYNVALSPLVHRTLAVVNIAMFVVATVLFFLEYFYYPNPSSVDADVTTVADWIIEVMFIAVFFVLGLVFLFFGLRVRSWSQPVSRPEIEIQSMVRRVVTTAAVLTTAFALRSVLIAVNLAQQTLQSSVAFLVVYYLALDFLPAVLVLLLLAGPPPPPRGMAALEKMPLAEAALNSQARFLSSNSYQAV